MNFPLFTPASATSLPTTTKGDLIVNNGSINTRLPVGSNGQVLNANSSASTGLEWAAAGANYLTRNATTTDSPSVSDDQVIYLSGASFTVTLPTAVGNTGKWFYFVHQGTSLTQVYTFNTTGGQTLGGIASGSYAFYTNGESFLIFSDGTNWRILNHYAETDWADMGAMTITGTSSNPTKATTREYDAIYMRRDGKFATFRYIYQAASATGSAAGSGGYIFLLPSSLTMDTTFQPVDTSVAWGLAAGTAQAIITNSHVAGLGTGTFTSGKVKAYDSTHVTAWAQINLAAQAFLGSANQPLTTANLTINLEFTVAISGWRS